MNMTVVERKTRLIGAIMVERGLLTPAQLREALEVQAERGGLLGEIVMAEFGVTRAQVSQVIAEQLAELEDETGSEVSSTTRSPQLRAVRALRDGEAHLPVGDALLELGLVSRDQIDSARQVQRETGERLGEILVEQGVISRLELADALSEHWSSLTKLRRPGVVDAPVESAPSTQISAEDLAALAGVVEGLGARLEKSIADRDRELTGHLEQLSTRSDGVAALHEQTGTRLDAIVSAQEAFGSGLEASDASRDRELTGQFERLSARVDLVATSHGQTSARLEAIATAQAAAASHESGTELQELTSQLERLSARLDDVAGQHDRALTGQIEGLSGRFDELAVLHERAAAGLAAIAASQEAQQGPAAGLEKLADQFERLSTRLEAGLDSEFKDQFEQLSSRFDAVATMHERTEGRLEAIAATQEAAGPGFEARVAERDGELVDQFDRLSVQLDELAGARDGARTQALEAQFARLLARLDELAVLHEQTGARLDAMAAALEADASHGAAAEFGALAVLVEGVGAGLGVDRAERDRELVGQFERLSSRLDEVVGGRDGELVSRFEELSTRIDALAVLHEQTGTRLETSVAGRDRELASHIEGLSAQVGVLVVKSQAEVLVERIASLDEAQQRGEAVLSRLVSEMAILYEQSEAILEARREWSAGTPDLPIESPDDSPKDDSPKKAKKKKKTK